MSNHRVQWAKDNPFVCPSPFDTISIRAQYNNDPELRYSCCCNFKAEEYDGYSTDQDLFYSLKQSMISGKPHRACVDCYKVEKQGVLSERLRYWMGYGENDFENLITNWHSDFFEVKVKFSNLCPLSCRSCSPSESSTYSKIVGVSPSSKFLETDISENLDHWKKIQQIIEEVSKNYQRPILHLIGGEPLVQPGALKLMQWMKENGLSEKFELRFTTSLAVNFKDQFVELMKDFKHICFLLSIDSVESNYHYVRWPANFDKIKTNLSRLHQIRSTLKSSSCFLTPVFSLNNIFYLPDYINYFHSWFAENGIHMPINNIHLHEPKNLQVEILPDPYRASLVSLLEKTLCHPLLDNPSQEVLRFFLVSTIDHLKNFPGQDELFEDYLKFTAEFDQKTKTSFEELNGELYDMLSIEHKQIYKSRLQAITKTFNIKQTI